MRRANYVWSDPARSLTVEIALPVVERLSLEAMEAFKSVPRRGLEIGGLVLGSATASRDGQTTISIDECTDVPSEHRSGPSYQLSPADLKTLDDAYSSHPRAVGMYRTDTQSEKLHLHQDDATLLERHFSRMPAVFLLIHPATRTAAFCVPDAGGLAVAHEFSFHPADLAPMSREAEVAVAVAERPAVQVRVRSSPRKRLWTIRAAALLVGGTLGAVCWRWLGPANRVAVPVRASVAPPAANPWHVAMNVTREGRLVRLVWDHEAPAVRQADHALLHITDGNHQTNLNLSSIELSTGVLSYWADTTDVTFRLEVFGSGGKTDDSVRAVGGGEPAAAMPAEVATAAERRETPHRWPKVSSRDRSAVEDQEGTASQAPAEQQRPSPYTPVPKPDPAQMQAVATPPPKPASAPPAPAPARTPLPRVEVSAEPAPPSRLTKVVRHIPLLRRLKKEQETVVPPEPLHETKPSLSAVQRQQLTTDVPIDVRVFVTESGSVSFAELVDTRHATRNRELADAAVVAARRWNFRPARVGDENVPSEVILHFRFKPAENQP